MNDKYENDIAICAERKKQEDIPSTQSLAIKGTSLGDIIRSKCDFYRKFDV